MWDHLKNMDINGSGMKKTLSKTEAHKITKIIFITEASFRW